MKKATTPPPYTESLKVIPRLLLWILAAVALLTIVLPGALNGNGWSMEYLVSKLGVVAIMACLWWFALASRIKLRLNAEGVSYQFWPLPKKEARWEELQGWYLREVNSFGEFGGWGLRWGFNLGWGYVNTSDWGLQLVYRHNKRVVISTESPEALRRWLEQYAPANTTGHESR